MEQKRVSFKVAEAIKAAGYPQEYGGIICSCDMPYYTKDGEKFVPRVANKERFATCPTYLDVWLWLQRDKNMYLIPEMKNYKFRCRVRQKPDGKPYFPPEPLSVSAKDNMEDAIIVAIDFLINNDFIK